MACSTKPFHSTWNENKMSRTDDSSRSSKMKMKKMRFNAITVSVIKKLKHTFPSEAGAACSSDPERSCRCRCGTEARVGSTNGAARIRCRLSEERAWAQPKTTRTVPTTAKRVAPTIPTKQNMRTTIDALPEYICRKSGNMTEVHVTGRRPRTAMTAAI